MSQDGTFDVLPKKEVIKLRKNMSIEEKNAENKKMDENFSKINIVAENYPELKSSENYKTLQNIPVDVLDYYGKEEAFKVIESSKQRYNDLRKK